MPQNFVNLGARFPLEPDFHWRQGGLFSDVHFLANFRITARLRERRPVSLKDWVTTLKPPETGRRYVSYHRAHQGPDSRTMHKN
jgi:hypothetical protein